MPTDYNTACGSLPLSLMQMLGASIVGYHNVAGVLHYRLNGVEVAGACGDLSDFLECDTSHIDPERQLVENVFTTDACSFLALKIFDNSDNDWVEYKECGEVPQTFIQMLARSIVTYLTLNRLNAVIESGECESLTALLDCTTNQIESERLLVQNLFILDDCDRLLIKFFANESTMTDYHTECTESPQSFYQLLARCIVKYGNYYYLNIASVIGYCDDLHAFWTCDNGHLEPERALVENLFATDSCGNLALKIFNNSGEEQR